MVFFFSNAPRKPFTTIPISGGTQSTSIFQEGRLGWTLANQVTDLLEHTV